MQNERFIATMVADAIQQNLEEYITIDDIKIFLSNQGYEWSGYYGDYFDRNLRFPYQYFDGVGYASNIDRKMIVLGNEQIWGDQVSMGIDGVSAKCVNNPFVRYIRHNANEFEVYNIVRVDAINDGKLNALNAGMYGAFKLEKDLSREWRRYLFAHNKQIRDTKFTNWQASMQEQMKASVGLGLKDGFKDTSSNDACLQYLTDIFGNK